MERDLNGKGTPQADPLAGLQRRLATQVASALTTEDVLTASIETVLTVEGVEAVAFFLVDKVREGFDLARSHGISPQLALAISRFERESHDGGLSWSGEPLFLTPDDLAESAEAVQSEGLQAIAVLPLSHDGQVLGSLCVGSHRPWLSGELREALLLVRADVARSLARACLEEELKYHVRFERLIAELSSRLINIAPAQLDAEFDKAVEELGRFAGTDRCYISVVGEDMRFEKDYEWCADGVRAQSGVLHSGEPADYPWGAGILTRGEVLHIPSVAKLPPEAAKEKALLEAQNVLALVNVPLLCGNGLVGFFGFDSVHKERFWSDETIALLSVLGHVFGNAVARQRADRELQYHIRFERLIAELTVRFVTIDTDDLARELEQALAIVGQFADVDRCYIGVIGEDGVTFETGYEWTADGIEGHPDVLDGIDVRDLPWAFEQLCNEGTIHLPRLDRLPPEAVKERHVLEQQQIRSLVNVRLMAGKKLLGLFGFDMVREERTWSQDTIALLEILGHMFGSAIERERAEVRRRRLEQQFQQSQKLESLGMLAGGIAHDFNNLLMGILGNVSLAQLDLPPEADVAGSLRQVETAAVRASELTRQLLAYAGRAQFVVEPLNLSELALEMAHLLETAISKKARLVYELDSELPCTEADPTQMRQVAMNLITNAADAIDGGDGVIKLRTGVTHAGRTYLDSAFVGEELPEGAYVYLTVSDNGRGMDPETQARIFDPFFSTKEEGHGLGLAASLGIVRGHGGGIRVDTGRGKGTSVTVLLPLRVSGEPRRERPAGALRSPLPEPQATGSGEPLEGLALVIDDEEVVRSVAKDILEHYGFDVLTAVDGREGIDVFRQHASEIDLVVLDLTMPHMNGEEVFDFLREIRAGIPILLSSGYSQHDIATRLIGRGRTRFIQKPYQPDALFEKVRALLPQDAPPPQCEGQTEA